MGGERVRVTRTRLSLLQLQTLSLSSKFEVDCLVVSEETQIHFSFLWDSIYNVATKSLYSSIR